MGSLALLLSTWLAAGPATVTLAAAAPAPAGFDGVVLTQVNALFGSENLPQASGTSVQSGATITVSAQQLLIYDEKLADLEAGRLPAGPASRECKSGCQQLLWVALRRMWLQALEEAQRFSLEVPGRVCLAVEASVPAETLVELAYAAAETRPGQPPSFSLLVNGGNAGLRARDFLLLPPGGLRVAPGDGALGLRVVLGAEASFRIDAVDPRFARTVTGTGWSELRRELAAIKKRYPNKATLIFDVGADASVADLVAAMVAAQKAFPRVVLAAGQPLRWG